jgi:hypothetical protein
MANIFHIERITNKITLGTADTTIIANPVTASSIVAVNASKELEPVTIGDGLDYTRPTLSLSYLGFESLTDPGADRIVFWDDSETTCGWLTCGNSLAITTTTIDTIQDIRTIASPTFVGLDLTGTLTVDTINEHTGAAGVTIEGILIKDSDINLQDYDAIFFGDAQDAYMYFDETRLLINSVSEVWIGVEYDKSLVAGNLFSNGNMNIGYTAMRHNWKSYYDVLEIGGTGALFCNTSVIAGMAVGISQNAYFDETNERWEYAVADEASVYIQNIGRHIFYVNDGDGADVGGPISWSCGLIVEKDATVTCEGTSVTIGKLSTTTGSLILCDSNSANTITITAPDISAGSLVFTLPATDGDDGDVLQTNGSGVLSWTAAGGDGADEKVKIDAAATAGYIGAANSDGVLRCSANTTGGLSYTDGGDYVTIDLSINGLSELNPPTLAQTYVPVYNTGSSTQYKVLATNFGFFVDRGDSATHDWDQTTLTTDGAYHDLDCSPVVPAGAKAILFRVTISDNLVQQSFIMRENGNSNAINKSIVQTQVANVINDADMIVACDSDRVVEYGASNTTWTNINIAIRGWWF